MRRTAVVLAAGLMLASSGCYFGPRATTYGPARSAQGIRVEVNGGVTAELLVVSDTALLVRRVTPSRLVIVPYARLRSVTFRQNAMLNFGPSRDGRVPPAALRAEWRLVARYPQGLTTEQVHELLGRMSQPGLDSL